MSVSLGRSPAADPMGPEMPGALHVTNWNSYRLPFDGDPIDVAVKCADEMEAVIIHQGRCFIFFSFKINFLPYFI